MGPNCIAKMDPFSSLQCNLTTLLPIWINGGRSKLKSSSFIGRCVWRIKEWGEKGWAGTDWENAFSVSHYWKCVSCLSQGVCMWLLWLNQRRASSWPRPKPVCVHCGSINCCCFHFTRTVAGQEMMSGHLSHHKRLILGEVKARSECIQELRAPLEQETINNIIAEM